MRFLPFRGLAEYGTTAAQVDYVPVTRSYFDEIDISCNVTNSKYNFQVQAYSLTACAQSFFEVIASSHEGSINLQTKLCASKKKQYDATNVELFEGRFVIWR